MTDQEKVLQCFRTPMLGLKNLMYISVFLQDRGIHNYQVFVSDLSFSIEDFLYIEYWQLSRPNDPMAVKPTVDPK